MRLLTRVYGMPMSPKVTITLFIGQKLHVVQEMYGLIHISDFESIKCGKFRVILIYFTAISLVNQTLTCSLITMGGSSSWTAIFP